MGVSLAVRELVLQVFLLRWAAQAARAMLLLALAAQPTMLIQHLPTGGEAAAAVGVRPLATLMGLEAPVREQIRCHLLQVRWQVRGQ